MIFKILKLNKQFWMIWGWESSMDMNFLPWHWSERRARVQVSSVPFLSVAKKSGPMHARVFIVAVAVIVLFKNAETPGAFLRHQVGGQGLLRFWGTSICFGPAPKNEKKAGCPSSPFLVFSGTGQKHAKSWKNGLLRLEEA